MIKLIKEALPKAALCVLVFTILCGGIYTLLITGAAQLLFPGKADGSIIEVNGTKYGSALLAQEFTGEQYMWGRIMNLDAAAFTDEEGNPAVYSWARNLSPAGEEFQELTARRVEEIRAAHPEKEDAPVPADLVTCSGSGLDPHISPAAADYQVARIARVRGVGEETVRQAVSQSTTGRFLGIFGEPAVNVLEVNLILDGIL